MLHRLSMQVNWLKFKYKLRALIHVGCWVRNHSTDREWDQELWDLLSRGKIEYVSSYYAIVGTHKVWIENYPYASGVLELASGPRRSCSRATALLLEKELPTARIMQRLKGLEPRYGQLYTSRDGQHIV
jgi:hypothetical protein